MHLYNSVFIPLYIHVWKRIICMVSETLIYENIQGWEEFYRLCMWSGVGCKYPWNIFNLHNIAYHYCHDKCYWHIFHHISEVRWLKELFSTFFLSSFLTLLFQAHWTHNVKKFPYDVINLRFALKLLKTLKDKLA